MYFVYIFGMFFVKKGYLYKKLIIFDFDVIKEKIMIF